MTCRYDSLERIGIRCCAAFVLCLGVWMGVSWADVPTEVTYQGYLVDSLSVAVSGEFSMEFRLYSTEVGGVPLWTETQDTVHVQGGVFSVLLGSANPLPSVLFDGSKLWLGTTIGIGSSELSPRRALVSVAYTFRAEEADHASTADTAAVALSTTGGDSCLWLTDGNNVWRSGGNVGIGTATPLVNLEVRGTNPSIRLGHGANTDVPYLQAMYNDLTFGNAGGGEWIRITNVGNVGIGTTTPGAKLEVNGLARFSSTLLYGYTQYADLEVTVGGAQSELRWIRVPYSDGSPLRFTIYRYTHENGSWVGQLSATVSTTIGDWGSLAGRTFVRVEKAEFPEHLLRKVVSCECYGGGESGIYLQVLGGRTYHFSGLPGSPTDVGASDPSCPSGSRVLEVGSGSGIWVAPSLVVGGDLCVLGQKNAVVPTSKGMTKVYSEESTEIWFSDYGEGRLENGRAEIQLDPLFLETTTIDENNPMKVFVTFYDDHSGYKIKRGTASFEVVELEGGSSNASFSYRVVAKRVGMERARLETMN